MMRDNRIPEELPCEVVADRRRFSIGLPSLPVGEDRCFPLTPEAVAGLVDKGVVVKMEEGAATQIHYPDMAYLNAGARIVTRKEALGCDIVVYTAPVDPVSVGLMRRGAMLFTLYRSIAGSPGCVNVLKERSVTSVALDRIEESGGSRPVADILDEIAGFASVVVASSLMSDPFSGKGILMGGIAGIVPCEVTVMGAGIAGCAAARAAIGAGATVRMFDNDSYRLRKASASVGNGMIMSVLQSHVVEGALRSADVVVVTGMRHAFEADARLVGVMKRRVMIFDVTGNAVMAFPSVPVVDLAISRDIHGTVQPGRVCYVNASSRVPRTVAMAMSNFILCLMDDMIEYCGNDRIDSAVKLMPGFRRAIVTFVGRLVDRDIAIALGIRSVDLSILLSLS